jgi:hypothetical protein
VEQTVLRLANLQVVVMGGTPQVQLTILSGSTF